VPVAGSLPEFLGLFTLPRFSALLNGEVLLVAFTIAAVASVETLLCIDAVDKMDPQRRLTDQNRELKAQGIGNMVSGLLGGLPITSVIVRSSANVNAGARSKASTILHGALILVCCLFIPHLLNRIPLGALAAILLMTGYKLARPSVFRDMFAHGKYQWVPFLVTVVAVVGTDLLTGVGLGLLTSMVAVLYGNVKNPFRLREEASPGGGVRMILSEEVSFLNKARIKKALEELPPHSTVVIDAHLTRYIDFDVLELIREFRAVKAPERNIRCLLTGFREEYGLENHRPVSPESPAFAYVSNRELVGQEGKLMSN
jgi:carbonic anhydrase